MEHRALNTVPRTQIWDENLIETYLALGLAMPKTRLERGDGFVACLGEIDHPVANFACRLRLNPNSAARLRHLCDSMRSFHVYHLPQSEPDYVPELLERAGLYCSSQLVQMHWQGVCETPESQLGIHKASSGSKRVQIATFMADQFFGKQSSSFRAGVIQATSSADKLDLYEVVHNGNTIAAFMLCDHPNSIGLYNLCLQSSLRHRGWGSKIVERIQHLAFLLEKPIVLQCEERLRPWYEAKSFAEVGQVHIYRT